MNINDNDVKIYNPQTSKIPLASTVISKERSLIAIFPSGKTIKEDLSQSGKSHAKSTYEIAKKEGIILNEDCIPQETEINAALNGIVIFQIEGKHCFIYFPEFISYEQLESIKQEILILPNHIFYYTISNSQKFQEKVSATEIISQAINLSIPPLNNINIGSGRKLSN